ncbi:hypothetical protein E2986_12798 [Frieseomelitta varia]|uniref:Uncharacterized protein n=1 Tax=Frieseomelitta varia TaxID=561572 RepID=A0A833S2V0_9HYME|nr:hypothetical protein E2986_12798 [Frieseomelitta varia]
MTRITSVVLAVTIRNRDFIVQRAASDPQGGRLNQLDRTPEHQSAVSVINGELLAARTSPWEFRETTDVPYMSVELTISQSELIQRICIRVSRIDRYSDNLRMVRKSTGAFARGTSPSNIFMETNDALTKSVSTNSLPKYIQSENSIEIVLKFRVKRFSTYEGEDTLSERTCQIRFAEFRSGDFNVEHTPAEIEETFLNSERQLQRFEVLEIRYKRYWPLERHIFSSVLRVAKERIILAVLNKLYNIHK